LHSLACRSSDFLLGKSSTDNSCWIGRSLISPGEFEDISFLISLFLFRSSVIDSPPQSRRNWCLVLKTVYLTFAISLPRQLELFSFFFGGWTPRSKLAMTTNKDENPRFLGLGRAAFQSLIPANLTQTSFQSTQHTCTDAHKKENLRRDKTNPKDDSFPSFLCFF
jgi:hypothetical protein